MDEENSKLRRENIELKKKLDKVEEENAELKKKNAELMEQIEAMKAEKSKEKIAAINDLPISRGIKRLPSENEKSGNFDSKKIKQQLAIMEEDEDGISVPNWLIDVLKWINRIEMANSSLSFSCKLFKRLCWPKLHGNVKAHFVPWLSFYYGSNKFGNICGILKDQHQQIIPIASTPPPKYIHGFELIIISYLDIQIIEFVKNIGLKEINLSFNTSMQKLQKNDEQFTLMRNLLSIFANNIYKLQISNSSNTNHFLDFNRQFPTFIDQVPRLFVANINDLDFDILFKLLMKPLTNRRQKILHYRINFALFVQQREMEIRFINRIIEEFSYSTERKNFLVKLEQHYGQFSLQNEQTGEVLNLYQEMFQQGYNHYSNTFLARYPKKEEYWKERSVEKIYGRGKTHVRLN